jgi:hypothetical protein
MIRGIDNLCESLSRIPHSPALWILGPTIVAGVRWIQEMLLLGMLPGYAPCSLPFLNYLVTYMLEQVFIVGVFAVATGRNYRQFVGVVSVGLSLAWLPPLLDGGLLLLGFRPHQRMYVFFQDFRWHFFADNQLIGESLTLWLSILVVGVYLAWRSRSVVRTIFGTVLYYAAIQLLGFLWPLSLALIAGDLSKVPLQYMDLVGLGLYFCAYFLLNAKSMTSSLMRIGHALPWGLLAAIGTRIMGGSWWSAALNGAVFCAVVQMSVYLNDYFDRDIDGAQGGAARPVTRDDAVVTFFIQVVLALHVFWMDVDRFYLVVTFIALTLAYHHPEIRLKRVFMVAYFMEGAAAAIALMYGFGVDGLKGGPQRALLYVGMAFVGFCLGSIMKDYKDIEQDRSASVATFYTRLLGAGLRLPWIHAGVSTLLTVALAVPFSYLLFTGATWWQLAALGVLAVVPQICLLGISNARRAVQGALWSVNGYLGVLLFTVPTDSVRLFS